MDAQWHQIIAGILILLIYNVNAAGDVYKPRESSRRYRIMDKGDPGYSHCTIKFEGLNGSPYYVGYDPISAKLEISEDPRERNWRCYTVDPKPNKAKDRGIPRIIALCDDQPCCRVLSVKKKKLKLEPFGTRCCYSEETLKRKIEKWKNDTERYCEQIFSMVWDRKSSSTKPTLIESCQLYASVFSRKNGLGVKFINCDKYASYGASIE